MITMRTHSTKSAMLLAVLAAACFAAPTRAQSATSQTSSPSASARLVSVAATGSVRFHSDQIAQATGLKPGDTVTREDLQKGADRLVALGTFATVHYRFSTIETGVKVEYQLTDAPAVPVAFDNFPWLTDDELVTELKSTVFLFDGTAPEHGGILDEISSSLDKLLERHGVFANVKYEVATSPVDNRDVVQFTVEGAGLNVKSLDFPDALAKSDRGIHEQLSELVDKPFSRSAVEMFEAEQIRPVYLSHGFLRVQFALPIARLEGTSNRDGPNPVDVLAPIYPGIAYAWGGVAWSGDSAIAAADLDKLVLFRPGELADGMMIQGVWEKVRAAYARQGYLDATVEPTAQFDDTAKRANYSCVIEAGTQYHMGKLILSGLSLEGERRIRTTWRMSAGAVFNEIAYQDFLVNGVKAAFMGFPAHYEKIGRFLQKDPKSGVVDVLLDFQ
jgi:outer membrane protein insertion porin family